MVSITCYKCHNTHVVFEDVALGNGDYPPDGPLSLNGERLCVECWVKEYYS